MKALILVIILCSVYANRSSMEEWKVQTPVLCSSSQLTQIFQEELGVNNFWSNFEGEQNNQESDSGLPEKFLRYFTHLTQVEEASKLEMTWEDQISLEDGPTMNFEEKQTLYPYVKLFIPQNEASEESESSKYAYVILESFDTKALIMSHQNEESQSSQSNYTFYGVVKFPIDKISANLIIPHNFDIEGVQDVEYIYCQNQEIISTSVKMNLEAQNGKMIKMKLTPIHNNTLSQIEISAHNDSIKAGVATYVCSLTLLIILWIIGIRLNRMCIDYMSTTIKFKSKCMQVFTICLLKITVVLAIYCVALANMNMSILAFVANFLIGNWEFYFVFNILTLTNSGMRRFTNWKMFLVAFIIILILVIYSSATFFPYTASVLLFSPWLYCMLTNIWWVVVIVNFILKDRYVLPLGMCLLASAIICFSPVLRTNGYFDAFSLAFSSKLFVGHNFGIFVNLVQVYYGSRFMLPRAMRSMTYDKFLHTVGQDIENVLSCQICLNNLDQPELEYSDSDPSYKWKKFDMGVYVKTQCDHVFHPNCIFKVATKDPSYCPVCEAEIPKYQFDD